MDKLLGQEIKVHDRYRNDETGEVYHGVVRPGEETMDIRSGDTIVLFKRGHKRIRYYLIDFAIMLNDGIWARA